MPGGYEVCNMYAVSFQVKSLQLQNSTVPEGYFILAS